MCLPELISHPLCIVGVGISIIAILFYFDVYGVRRWLNSKYNGDSMKFMLMKQLLSLMIKKLTTKVQSPKFAINDSRQSASLTFPYLGKIYPLNVPYKQSLVVKMSALQVFLIMKTGTELNITQPPGIPYMVSAKDMGGKGIRIINLDTRKNKIYEEDEIPFFADDLYRIRKAVSSQ